MHVVAVDQQQQPAQRIIPRRQSPTVPYHPEYARIGGSVVAGLMLARAVELQKEAESQGREYWRQPAVRWFQELSISRAQLETAASKIEAAGYLMSVVRGSPPTKHYRVDIQAVESALRSNV